MTIEGIVQELDAEIARLQQARKLLSNGSRLNAISLAALDGAATPKAGPGKRTLSPEARKRIAEAQRKRWAATRKPAAK